MNEFLNYVFVGFITITMNTIAFIGLLGGQELLSCKMDLKDFIDAGIFGIIWLIFTFIVLSFTFIVLCASDGFIVIG